MVVSWYGIRGYGCGRVGMCSFEWGKGAGLDGGVVVRGMVVWSAVVWGLGVPTISTLGRLSRPYRHFLY